MGLVIVAWLLLACVPSVIAAHRGWSPFGFYLFGLVGLIPAVIVILLLPARPTSVAAMRDRSVSR